MEYNFDRILRSVLPKGKVNHSKRVAKKLTHLPATVQDAALFHDYLERGGSIDDIIDKLHPESVELINLLTNETGESVIKHVKNTLNAVENEELRNFLILIKIADRKDNYTKRLRRDTLTKKYKIKTKKLLKYLIASYTGNKKHLKKVIQ
jgi:16S rRNA C1402 (ribose-2'-O) methylase RsmI